MLNFMRGLIDFVVDPNGARAGLETVRKEFHRTLDSMNDRLKSFKPLGGVESFIGNVGRTLKTQAVGPLGGAILLSRGIERLADKYYELQHAMQQGEMTQKEFVGGMLRTVPVLGDMVKMWDAVLGRTKEELKLREQMADLDNEKQAYDKLASLKDQLSLLNVKKGLDRELLQIEQEYLKSLKEGSSILNPMLRMQIDALHLLIANAKKKELIDDDAEKKRIEAAKEDAERGRAFMQQLRDRIREQEKETRQQERQRLELQRMQKMMKDFGRETRDIWESVDDYIEDASLRIGAMVRGPQQKKLEIEREYAKEMRKIREMEERIQDHLGKVEDPRLAQMKKMAANLRLASLLNMQIDKHRSQMTRLDSFATGGQSIASGLGARITSGLSPEFKELQSINRRMAILIKLKYAGVQHLAQVEP